MGEPARILERAATAHPSLADALAAIDRALIEGGIAEDKLAEAARALAFDPAALEADEARLFELRGVARKHRVEPDALAALSVELTAKLEAIDAGNDGLAALEAAAAKARDTYLAKASALSQARVA